MVKSADEIARIRRSVATNSEAFEQAVRRVKPGMKESELAAELEYRMRRLGAEKPSFDTIVAGGARSALPHAQPTAARLENGQLVVVDMGALQDGYCSDMTRMLFLGTPGAKVKRTYRAVLEAQLAAIDAVRAGRTDAERRSSGAPGAETATGSTAPLSTRRGTDSGWRSTSRLVSAAETKTSLQAGMAITIEPGVYLEGFGGIRIEDTVLVTETGCEILTPTPKDLRIC